VRTLDGLGAIGGNAHAEGEWIDLASLPERAALVGSLTATIGRAE
jgi:glutamate carboxypeptidase